MSTLETGIVTHPTVPPDWDRYFERDRGRGNAHTPDAQVWQEMTNLVLAADDLGYDFVFAPEHHVSPYGLSPDPLQWMTYIAGRTRRVNLGTSVVVLPWHHPLRVAEQISLLDNFAPDRRKLIGLGRGVAPFEYEALAVPYDDRRERFDESVEIIKLALSLESFSYDGQVFQVPEVTLRPKPVNPDLVDGLLAAATGDETLIEGGKRGLGMLYAGQKSVDLIRTDLALVNGERVRAGFEPCQPVLLVWLYCAESEQEALDCFSRAIGAHLFELTNNYAQRVVWSDFDRDRISYREFVEAVQNRATPENHAQVQAFIDKQIWGTPEQCLEKVRALQEASGARNISFQVQYGDVTNEVALANLRLFAKSALDKLHTIPSDPPDWLLAAAHDAPGR
jgi:alkanesulfonate monooxygenase SsuD/methylene tetrahydromethanopterin reductase-like flavin-dependent oxidoreductase (luciferase family)